MAGPGRIHTGKPYMARRARPMGDSYRIGPNPDRIGINRRPRPR
ncbi:hypothetical protein AZ16_1100 [Bordetella bronchiseptica B18-5 (C3)]|nr:hypothetical protein AZ16_1100 [Bordetella bronchiseptica B18-5 (C3)]KDC58567.1 hypothetical protein L511_1154 [Bordetella bronchiseptica MBORD595]KDC87677.1 hypothetical protein L516_1159 [Bordetella bronchiseptica MBORD668]KDC88340.1 hypothetical protein L515_1232 [Bordetella bronchiseptica MBORD665]KDD92970.1 hypothetical protein L524_0976 [Bordetella bronchiseptica MBORD762]